jgi:hypothetical protein
MISYNFGKLIVYIHFFIGENIFLLNHSISDSQMFLSPL